MLKYRLYGHIFRSFIQLKKRCLFGVQENSGGGGVRAIFTMSKYKLIFFRTETTWNFTKAIKI